MCKYYVLTIENTRFTQVSIIIYKKGGIMYTTSERNSEVQVEEG